MSVEKAELRAQVVHDIGVRFDDVLEASRAAVHRAEGAESALREAAEAVRQQLHAEIDRKIGASEFDLEQGKIAKEWVSHAVSVLNQLATNTQQVIIAQRGHTQGITFAVSYLKRIHEQELQALTEQRARDTDTEFRSVKEERLAEEAAERASQPPAAPESLAPPDGTPRPRRRRKATEQHGADA